MPEGITLTDKQLDAFWEWVQENWPATYRLTGAGPMTKAGLKSALEKREEPVLQALRFYATQTGGTPEFGSVDSYLTSLGGYLNAEIDAGRMSVPEAEGIINQAKGELEFFGLSPSLPRYTQAFQQQTLTTAQRRTGVKEAAREEQLAREQQQRVYERQVEFARTGDPRWAAEFATIQAQIGAQPRGEFFADIRGRQMFTPLGFGAGTVGERQLQARGRQMQAQTGQQIFQPDPQVVQQLAGAIAQAEQYGVDTKFAQGELNKPSSEQAIGNVLIALSTQADIRRRAQEEQGSRLLAQTYPKWFERYATGRQWAGEPQGPFAQEAPTGAFVGAPTYEGWEGPVDDFIAPTALETFGQWQDPAFKEFRLQRETEMLRRWPTLFPAYQAAPTKERLEAGGFQPWAQATVPRRAKFQERQAELTRPRRVRTPRFATFGR